MTLPIAPLAGLASGMAAPIAHFIAGQWDAGINDVARNFTGIDPPTGTWHPEFLMRGTVPLIVGALVHKFVGGYLGINRMLAAAGVPIIRL